MKGTDNLDQVALTAAKQHMGSFAWPTVLFGVSVVTAYLATLLLATLGILPLPVAVLPAVILTYLSYTVLHEAAHGTISGSHQSRRWINEWLGYAAAWILMIPLTAHRHEHLAHHRNTNQADGDPDFVVSDMARSPLGAVGVALKVALSQYSYYANHRWGRGPRSQDVTLCLEIAAALVPRLALIGAGFWVEGLALFVLAWSLGLALTLYLFAYLVHTPHESVGRYVDTSTILVDGFLGKIVTGLWVYQNYHSIHHLFPRVPFYRYPSLFEEIEDTMVAKGAPIYRLGFRGLQEREGIPA
jgi:beta-carotene hydroxylase